MYKTFEDFQCVGVKCRAIEALYMVFMLEVIQGSKCFRVIGLIPSGPGDVLLSNPLKAAAIFSSVIQSVYLFSLSIDVLG